MFYLLLLSLIVCLSLLINMIFHVNWFIIMKVLLSVCFICITKAFSYSPQGLVIKSSAYIILTSKHEEVYYFWRPSWIIYTSNFMIFLITLNDSFTRLFLLHANEFFISFIFILIALFDCLKTLFLSSSAIIFFLFTISFLWIFDNPTVSILILLLFIKFLDDSEKSSYDRIQECPELFHLN